MLRTYRGSCHCGAVTFEADIDLAQPTYRCNCSICRRTRFWAGVVRPEGFRLVTGEGELIRSRLIPKRIIITSANIAAYAPSAWATTRPSAKCTASTWVA